MASLPQVKTEILRCHPLVAEHRVNFEALKEWSTLCPILFLYCVVLRGASQASSLINTYLLTSTSGSDSLITQRQQLAATKHKPYNTTRLVQRKPLSDL